MSLRALWIKSAGRGRASRSASSRNVAKGHRFFRQVRVPRATERDTAIRPASRLLGPDLRHRHDLIGSWSTVIWGGNVGASTSRTSSVRKSARRSSARPCRGHRPPSCCGGSSKRPGSAAAPKRDEDATNQVDPRQLWPETRRASRRRGRGSSTPRGLRLRGVLGPNPQIASARSEPKPGPCECRRRSRLLRTHR